MQNAILHTVTYIFIVFNQTCSQKKSLDVPVEFSRCLFAVIDLFLTPQYPLHPFQWSLFSIVIISGDEKVMLMNIRDFLTYMLSTFSTHFPLKQVFFIYTYIYIVPPVPQIS